MRAMGSVGTMRAMGSVGTMRAVGAMRAVGGMHHASAGRVGQQGVGLQEQLIGVILPAGLLALGGLEVVRGGLFEGGNLGSVL